MKAMRVLSSAEMQACDRVTKDRFGVPSLDLMRNAALSAASFVQQQFPVARRVTVLCGRGNNGGDGMMTARLLAAAGLEVTTLLLGAPEGFGSDVATAWGELLASAGRGAVRVVQTAEDLKKSDRALHADVLIDAVVGTGFKPPLKGLALSALEWVKNSAAPVVSIDLPSGWAADSTSATAGDVVFPSAAVITFTAPKPAHVFGQLTKAWDQPVVVAAIGSPEKAIRSTLGIQWAGAAMDMVKTPRAAASNKGNFGHVLVVGGAVGRSGAPSMTSLAALRSGAGLVTAAVPAAVLDRVSAFAAELMTWPLPASADGGISLESLVPEAIAALVKGMTVLAIGPGLGQATDTVKFVTGLLAGTKIPAVIDADALNILATKPVLLAKLAKGRTVVLTPHPGEMARLAGMTVAEVQANRLEVGRKFVKEFGVTLVLKGARTLVVHPDGRVAVNTTGNPGMAKGGSGDLLTGLVAGLMAQYPDHVDKAVEAAVYLHGLAADFAVHARDEHTLLATDGLQQLSRAFRFESRGENGYVWLQGLPAKSRPSVCPNEASR
jgi:hydroxyethylthiazole kinase-like uncharacterized protein yjeF